jgi:NADH-quinone oxidoreductase subunit M
MHIPILSILIWLPLASAFVAAWIPSRQKNAFRIITLATWFLQGIGIIWMLMHYAPTSASNVHETITGNLYFVERIPWISFPLGKLGILSIQYFLGIDSLNVGLVVLAWLVIGIGAIASWSIKKYVKAYLILYLILNALIIGSLVSLDLLLFYIFFEITLIPIYFFIALWGGTQGPQAATKFFLYTLLGTLCMLVVIIGLGLSAYDPMATGIQASLLEASATQSATSNISELIQQSMLHQQIAPQDIVHTFDMTLLTSTQNFIPGSAFHTDSRQLLGGYPVRLIGFLLLVCGLLIKLAAIPFHSWLPAAHVQAPTPISIILAGIMLKLGGYGLLRAYSIFPEGAVHYSWWMGLMGIVSIIYAALNALAMQDLKKMVAYSSITHMGFFLLGISSLTAEGIQGALYQLISHGLIASLLFLIVDVLDKRTHDRVITHYSGLATRMPYYTTFTLLAFAAAMGIPGFSSFIAELLILLGVFQSSTQQILPVWMGIVGSIGILLNATYYVWTIQRMFGRKFSVQSPELEAKLQDLSKREIAFLLAVLLLIIGLGIFPNLFFNFTQDALASFVDSLDQVGQRT